jgi:hypothetical protein
MDDRWAEYLTGTMREIADSIGMAGAAALWSKLRGQDIWIAEDWQKNKELIELIGEERAKKLSADFGSECIYVPGDEIQDFVWAETIIGFDREAISTVQIAKRMGLTRTKVYLLRKKFAGCKDWLADAELMRIKRKKILQMVEYNRGEIASVIFQAIER